MDWGYIAKNPVLVKNLPTYPDPDKWFSEDEWQHLLARANPGLRKYMLVGYYTGARRYTLWSLKEHHVNLKTGTISLPRPKGHRDLVLRMNDKLKAELATWLTGDPQAFLLPRLRLDSISRAFRRLNQQCVRLKLIRRAHSFHAIRHTTASHMA